MPDFNKRDKATILFALNFLKANLDSEIQEAMTESVFLSGVERPDEESISETISTAEQISTIEHDFHGRKITDVIKDDDLEILGDVRDLLDSGGGMIDSCMETPVALFRVDGDPRWWAGTVEFVIAEANPELIIDEIKDKLEAVRSEEDDEDEEGLVADEQELLGWLQELGVPDPADDEDEDEDEDDEGEEEGEEDDA